MIYATNFTLTQALQLVALVPCLLVILYLLFNARNRFLVIIPILYFLSLALWLLNGILPAFVNYKNAHDLQIFMILGSSFIPSLSFLLIFQFILNRIPPAIYWSVLLIPLLALSPFVYLMVHDQILCIDYSVCFPSQSAYYINHVIISAFVFILITLIFARKFKEIAGSKSSKRYKYWLVISLVLYNIVMLLISLLFVAEKLTKADYDFAITMIAIAFIYMVITSIFRVFTDLFDIKHSRMAIGTTGLTKYEQSIAIKAEDMLEQEKIYRYLEFNRAYFADTLGVAEHILSHVVNIEFKKSISELANDYRIKEAKELLSATNEPITTVSFDVGFSSITSFNRVFKEMVGMSPSEFRENSKKQII